MDKPRNLSEEGQYAIAVGHLYKEDHGLMEVIPLSVDLVAAKVVFSKVGSSHEDLMRTSDFLNRFSYVGPL